MLPAVAPPVKHSQSVLPIGKVGEFHRPSMGHRQNDCSLRTQDSSSLVQSRSLTCSVLQYLGHDDHVEERGGERQCLRCSAQESCPGSVPINSVLDIRAVDVQAITVMSFVTKRRQ